MPSPPFYCFRAERVLVSLSIFCYLSDQSKDAPPWSCRLSSSYGFTASKTSSGPSSGSGCSQPSDGCSSRCSCSYDGPAPAAKHDEADGHDCWWSCCGQCGGTCCGQRSHWWDGWWWWWSAGATTPAAAAASLPPATSVRPASASGTPGSLRLGDQELHPVRPAAVRHLAV